MTTATAEKPKRGRPPKKTTLQTELGIKIAVLQSHKDAEHVAHLREAHEVAQSNYKRRLDPLLAQMQRDGLESVTAKTAAGFTYKFSRESKGDQLKVRRIVEKAPGKGRRKH